MSVNSQRLEEFRNAKMLYDQMMEKTMICRRNMEKMLLYENSELCKLLIERDIMEKLQFLNFNRVSGILEDSIENLDATDANLQGSQRKKTKLESDDDDNDYNPAQLMDVRAK